MNKVQGLIVSAVALVGLISGSAGGVLALDNRYVMSSEYKDFQWAVLKGQLRDLQKAQKETSDPLELERIQYDIQDLLDLICRKYPEDRECRS